MAALNFYLPVNLDIDEVISKNSNLFHHLNLSKDKLLFICHSIITSRSGNRKKMNKIGTLYAPLCSEQMDKVVHNYKDAIRFLMKTNIIDCDNQFIEGAKCMGFCFKQPYRGQEICIVTSKNYKIGKGIRRLREYRKERNRKEMWGYGYLQKWWDSDKFKIDFVAAFSWIDSYCKTKSTQIFNTIEAGDKRDLEIANVIDTCQDFKHLVKLINNGDFNFRFSGEGHRLYTNLTNLKKELRNFLTYDGKNLANIDIKNSQPYLSIALLQPSFWFAKNENLPQILCLDKMNKKLYKEIVRKKGEYNNIITLLETSETPFQQGFALKNYIDRVASGEFYKYIQKHFQPLYGKRFDNRDKVKKEVLCILYSDPKIEFLPYYDPNRTFAEHFPEVYQIFKQIKLVEYTYLPLILQRIESFLVIDVICKRISKIRPDIPLFTIHDSILTTKGNEGFVEQIMTQEIANWIGYPPKLDIKELTPEILSVGNTSNIVKKVIFDFSKIKAA